MGWAGGSELYDEVISVIEKEVSDFDTKVRMHKKLIDAFWDQDWDTQYECIGRDAAFDKAWEELSNK